MKREKRKGRRWGRGGERKRGKGKEGGGCREGTFVMALGGWTPLHVAFEICACFFMFSKYL